MKLVIAYIQPFKLDEVREALQRIGVSGMTVNPAEGFGRQNGQRETYRGTEYAVDLVPKIRLEILTDDHIATDVVGTIEESARTGRIGDGKIAVIDVEDIVRIRTGERGRDAL